MSDVFSSWFRSFASCCGARRKPQASGKAASDRSIVVLRDQPAFVQQQPSPEPAWWSGGTSEKEPERARLRRPASRESSARRNWFARSPSLVRGLHISGPTNFRHVQSDSFQFPPQPARPRPRSFRPIELSIYQPDNRLSAILPHVECDITPPPPVHMPSSARGDGGNDGATAGHDRTHSTMSFHLPRKHVRQGSGMSDAATTPPRIPPKSRARASTAPATERIVERIASAIIEKERLQAEINSVLERQSIYLGRPLTGYDMRGFEPMPSIPALPAAAPSFAERLSVDDHPHTAQSPPTAYSTPSRSYTTPPTAHTSPASRASQHRGSPPASDLDRPLAPPLPLVLRPPLRKKKSFSRVSHWLLQPDGAGGADDAPPTMVFTTSPRPVRESDGFYQCVAPPEGLPRTSMETSSSVYTWGTRETGASRDDADDDDDDDDESKTLPTTAAWSPEQTPKHGSRHTTPVIGAGRGAAFEKETAAPAETVTVAARRPLSVGVAF